MMSNTGYEAKYTASNGITLERDVEGNINALTKDGHEAKGLPGESIPGGVAEAISEAFKREEAWVMIGHPAEDARPGDAWWIKTTKGEEYAGAIDSDMELETPYDYILITSAKVVEARLLWRQGVDL